MPAFKFRAINPSNNLEEAGVVEGADESHVSDILASRGLQIVSLEQQNAGNLSSITDFFSRVTVKDIVAFSREFAVMVGASVPIVESLKVISQQAPKPKLRRILATIADDVDSGQNLSGALVKYPHLFSNFYVSVVKSGEQSGKLDEALNYIADEMEKDYDMNSKIKGAMIYPSFVIVMMIGIGLLMMMFIVPKLTQIILEVGGQLPLATRILIAVSNFLLAYWWLLLLLLVIVFVVARYYLKSENGRQHFDYLLLHLPIFGKLLQMIYIVRFTRSMNTLIIGGVNISTSLQVAGEVVNNKYFQELINQTIIEVQGGNSICTVFVKAKEVPTMVSQMMIVGEKTGKLDVVLDRITVFYNREITTMLAGLMSLIEPLLMVVMGVGVAVMVAAILLPMYNVVSQV